MEKIRAPYNMPINTNILPLKKLRTALQKKKILTILLSIALTLAVTVIAIGYLSTPDYLPYSKDVITITKQVDGRVFAQFGNGVSGYSLEKYPTEDNLGFIYHISTWDSMWSRYIAKNSVQDIVLNPDGEKVSSIYYSFSDGKEDILIYGADQNPNGGIMMLPRLFLSYYATFALIMAVICGIVLFIIRKNERWKNIMVNILLLPAAYLLAHICIKGFTGVSYAATRDLFAILLATVFLYSALFITKLLLHRKLTQIK
ncbi:hypothetical protein [Aminipila luticellarii]|uniref:hypothetical protein n=1 Tax=Aminipila luticellarii TaxID=2507160 RepID=UPI001E3B441B|nr:hypothetical protein [Aminipila luticellarii]